MRVRWLLDCEGHCFPGAAMVHGNLRPVRDSDTLAQALRGDHDMFIQADITHAWWRRVLALPQVQVWCASPPCQPFSTAPSGAGVFAPDGKALLHVLASSR